MRKEEEKCTLKGTGKEELDALLQRARHQAERGTRAHGTFATGEEERVMPQEEKDPNDAFILPQPVEDHVSGTIPPFTTSHTSGYRSPFSGHTSWERCEPLRQDNGEDSF